MPVGMNGWRIMGFSMSSFAWPVPARFGIASQGMATQGVARHGQVMRGTALQGKALSGGAWFG